MKRSFEFIADRVLAVLVPASGAAAKSCWTEDWCDRDSQGSDLLRRNCCTAGSQIQCSNWWGVCHNCC